MSDTDKLNINRDRLIAVIQYPLDGDPLACSYAIAEFDQGMQIEIITFDPFTWEVEDRSIIPLSPGMLLTALKRFGPGPAEFDEIDGVQLVGGDVATPLRRADYQTGGGDVDE